MRHAKRPRNAPIVVLSRSVSNGARRSNINIDQACVELEILMLVTRDTEPLKKPAQVLRQQVHSVPLRGQGYSRHKVYNLSFTLTRIAYTRADEEFSITSIAC